MFNQNKLEDYKIAIDRIPVILSSIENIRSIKAKLLSGNHKGVNISLLLNIDKTDNPSQDNVCSESFPGLMSSFSNLENFMSNFKKTCKRMEEYSTSYQPINERIAVNICDMLLQTLQEERDILITRIRNFNPVSEG